MIIQDKSKRFAVRIIRFYNYLKETRNQTLGRQILRSGTAIGANIAESANAQSNKDFLSKINIALKECLVAQHGKAVGEAARNEQLAAVRVGELCGDVASEGG